MRILKFGGTSVGSAESIRTVLSIIDASVREEPTVAVVSALGGITDQLVSAIALAEGGQSHWQTLLAEIRRRHLDLVPELVAGDFRQGVAKSLEARLTFLANRLEGVQLLRDCSPRVRDQILGSGEYLSSHLLNGALLSRKIPALLFDPARLIFARARGAEPVVDFEITNAQVRQALEGLGQGTVAVVGGFIAGGEAGIALTLGRGGSDYSATLIGAALKASRVEIWTDVDGVRSADPRLVPESRILTEISYREAEEMAFMGAKVLHPKTILPVKKAGIPVVIRNSFNPTFPGTRITADPAQTLPGIKSLSLLKNQISLSVQTPQPLSGGGFNRPLHYALANLRQAPLQVNQFNTGQEVQLLLAGDSVAEFRELLFREFEGGGENDNLPLVIPGEPVAVVTALHSADREPWGERMVRQLRREGISVRGAFGGGSDQTSVVVSERQAEEAIRVLHRIFIDEAAEWQEREGFGRLGRVS